MDKRDFESLEVGTEIQSWHGGPVYTVVSNNGGKIEAVQRAQIEIVGKGQPSEHYPWDVYEPEGVN